MVALEYFIAHRSNLPFDQRFKRFEQWLKRRRRFQYLQRLRDRFDRRQSARPRRLA